MLHLFRNVKFFIYVLFIVTVYNCNYIIYISLCQGFWYCIVVEIF